MVFSNLLFLYLFLPANIILYFISKNKIFRNAVLIAFSFFFYAWGEPVWVLLLLLSASVDYINGMLIEKFRGRSGTKVIVAFSLVFNIGILCFFKYGAFFINSMGGFLQIQSEVNTFTLPIGISFYTFQSISYIIDVYRGKVTAQSSYSKFLLFVSLYHRLVAGPIVRYGDIEKSLDSPDISAKMMSEGISRFCIGLMKKVFIANAVGELADFYMGGNIENLTAYGAWFGVFMFALQIYFDFSGYSDMAIGLGRMFGAHYNENFKYPYMATSVTDFWRRWHISLSSFFRDYLYIPLGGKYKRRYFNLLIVWMLTGLWHGANWNFVLWGIYYGVFIIAEKVFLAKILAKIPNVISRLYLILITLIGWVIFYFTDTGKLLGYISTMFSAKKFVSDTALHFNFMNNIFLILIAVAACTPVFYFIDWSINKYASHNKKFAYGIFRIASNILMLLICTALLIGKSYNPFLYFRF